MHILIISLVKTEVNGKNMWCAVSKSIILQSTSSRFQCRALPQLKGRLQHFGKYAYRVLQGWRIFVGQHGSIAIAPSTKSLWDFSTGLWIIAENKLCGKQKLMILTRSARSYLQMNATFMIFEAGYKRTTPQSHDFSVTTTKLPTCNLILHAYLFYKKTFLLAWPDLGSGHGVS